MARTKEEKRKHAEDMRRYRANNPEFVERERKKDMERYHKNLERNRERARKNAMKRNRKKSSKRNIELFGFDSEKHKGYLRKMNAQTVANAWIQELGAKNRREALEAGLLPEDFIFDV